MITDFYLKRNGANQVQDGQIDGVWMGYGKGRGRLTNGEFVHDGKDRKTVRLVWEHGKVIQEVSISPGSPFLRILYQAYGVNVVDLATPGGKKRGTYVFLGAREW